METELAVNAKRITDIVDWALHQGVRPFIPVAPANSSPFLTRMLSNNIVSVGDSTLEAVVRELRSEPKLQLFDGGVIRTKQGSGSALSLEELA